MNLHPLILSCLLLNGILGGFCAGQTLQPEPVAASKVLFKDDLSADWEKNWFLDGRKATVEHREGGLYFSGGTVTKADDPEEYHAHHAVLWTKREFEGDIRIRYTMTRVDKSNYGATLLYVQARGIGEEPYVEDIHAWRKLREVPDMSLYFKHMDLLSLSFRENLRCRRYPWQDSEGKWYPGRGLIKPMRDYPGIAPGKTYHVEVEKRGASLSLHLADAGSGEVLERFTWDTGQVAEGVEPRILSKGRIGFRHMSTRALIYRNFHVERL